MGRRGPKPAPLELSGVQRRQLVRAAADASDTAMAARARVVLLAAEGASNGEIAEAVGLNATTVGRWRTRFVAEGIAGLVDQRQVPVVALLPGGVSWLEAPRGVLIDAGILRDLDATWDP